MDKVYYAHTNGQDFLAILNPKDNSECVMFSDFDCNLEMKKSLSYLTKSQVIDFMNELSFDSETESIFESENVFVNSFDIDESFGNSNERYYSISEIESGQLDFLLSRNEVEIDLEYLAIILQDGSNFGDNEIKAILSSIQESKGIVII